MLVLLITGSGTVFAGAETEALKQRINVLENNNTKVKISAKLEITHNNKRESSTVIETAKLGVAVNFPKNLMTNIVFLSEGDTKSSSGKMSKIQVDTATIAGSLGNIEVMVGKFEGALTQFDTGDVDTLTQGLQLTTKINNIMLSMWTGNSSNNGFSIGYENENYKVGLESVRDAIANDDDDATTDDVTRDSADKSNQKGMAIHGQYSLNNTTVRIEGLKIKNAIDGNRDSKLTHIELEHIVGDWTFTVDQEKGDTNKMNDTKTNTFGISYAVAESISVSLENEKEKNYKHTNTLTFLYNF